MLVVDGVKRPRADPSPEEDAGYHGEEAAMIGFVAEEDAVNRAHGADLPLSDFEDLELEDELNELNELNDGCATLGKRGVRLRNLWKPV